MNIISYHFIDSEECEEAKTKICKEVGEANGFDWADMGRDIVIGDDRRDTDRICKICELYRVTEDHDNYRTKRIRCIRGYYFEYDNGFKKALDSIRKEIGYMGINDGLEIDVMYNEKGKFDFSYIFIYENFNYPELVEKICKENYGHSHSARHTRPLPEEGEY